MKKFDLVYEKLLFGLKENLSDVDYSTHIFLLLKALNERDFLSKKYSEDELIKLVARIDADNEPIALKKDKFQLKVSTDPYEVVIVDNNTESSPPKKWTDPASTDIQGILDYLEIDSNVKDADTAAAAALQQVQQAQQNASDQTSALPAA